MSWFSQFEVKYCKIYNRKFTDFVADTAGAIERTYLVKVHQILET